MPAFVCVHGHFYQPPRENPWLEAIEPQDSAYPYPNWNARILAECYRTNGAARIVDADGRIDRIVNNYARTSFNFGPTLLSWLADHAADVYGAIVDADRLSAERFGGHGSAMAQTYNHIILPLANERDRATQVRWGVRDFEARFGRAPQGMWLAETAADVASLEALAAEGIEFTVLAPRQAARVRGSDSDEWRDVTGGRVDPRRAYRCRLPSGRTIALFFYDGPKSQAVAFEHLLDDGRRFAQRLVADTDPLDNGLFHIATDGETYGHHHRHGEMALAYALDTLESEGLARITNYGEYLAMFPPTWEAEIVDNSSWSCAHGVERWRGDCGCSAGSPGWNQAWRKPLRDSLDWLRDLCGDLFEQARGRLFTDPWAARDRYIECILDRAPEVVRSFVAREAPRQLDESETLTAIDYLEMQRNALLMYTSCGWFFDDVSGTEAVQVLRYAGRAIELAERASGRDIEPRFLARIGEARSNRPDEGTGADIYQRHVAPARVDLRHVVAHHAVSSVLQRPAEDTRVYCYRIGERALTSRRAGKARLVLGTVDIESTVTLERDTFSFGALHFGDHNITGGVRAHRSDDDTREMESDVLEAFDRADLVEVQRRLDRHISGMNFSLKSLFRADRERFLERVLEAPLAEAEGSLQRLYSHHAPLMRYLRGLELPRPEALSAAARFVLDLRLRRALARDEPEPRELRTALDAAREVDVALDQARLAYAWAQTLERLARGLAERSDDLDYLERVAAIVDIAMGLPGEVEIWSVQNQAYRLLQHELPRRHDQAQTGSEEAANWVALFATLCRALRLRWPEGYSAAA